MRVRRAPAGEIETALEVRGRVRVRVRVMVRGRPRARSAAAAPSPHKVTVHPTSLTLLTPPVLQLLCEMEDSVDADRAEAGRGSPATTAAAPRAMRTAPDAVFTEPEH